MTTKPTLKLISNGDVIVHYHDYHKRKQGVLVPMCGKAKEKAWREDDGVGAEVCGACRRIHTLRQEKIAKARRARRMRFHERHKEKELEEMRSYRKACKEKVNRYNRVYRKRRRRNERAAQQIGRGEGAQESRAS